MNIARLFLIGVILIGVLYIVGIIIPAPPFNLVTNKVDRLINGGGTSAVGIPASMQPVSFDSAPSAPVTSGGSGGNGFDIGGMANGVVRSATEQARVVGQMRPLQAVENPFSASVGDWAVFIGFSAVVGWILFLLAGKGVKKGQDLAVAIKNGISLKTVLLLVVVVFAILLGYVEYQRIGVVGLAQYSGLVMASIVFIVFAMNFAKVTQTIAVVASGLFLLIGLFFLPVIGTGLLSPYADPQYVSQVEGMVWAPIQFVLSVTRETPIVGVVMGLMPFVLWFLSRQSSQQQGGH